VCAHSDDSGAIFSLPAVVALTMQDIVVPAPIVIPPVATMNEDEEHVL
jgi:hypothetical protein